MEQKIARNFNQKVEKLFPSEGEKEVLYMVLRNYLQSQNLVKLMQELSTVINQPSKLQLYEDIRPLIPPRHQMEYDQLSPQPPRPRLKVIRLRRRGNDGLGFAVRGGLEHGVGVYVSHVIPDSQAYKQGLQPGDEIVRVNGFTISQAIHEEVLSLIKARRDITLKVRGVGMIPVKEHINDQLTWRLVKNNKKSEVSSDVLNANVPDSASHPNQNANLTSQEDDNHNLTQSSASSAHSAVSDGQESGFDSGVKQMSASSVDIRQVSASSVDISHNVAPPSDARQISASSGDIRRVAASGRSIQRVTITINVAPGTSLGCSICSGPRRRPGIYIQSVRPGGLAEEVGLQAGDQIISVNGTSFVSIKHSEAVVVLKESSQLNITLLKGTGTNMLLRRKSSRQAESRDPPVTSQLSLTADVHHQEKTGQQRALLDYHNLNQNDLDQSKDFSQQVAPLSEEQEEMDTSVTSAYQLNFQHFFAPVSTLHPPDSPATSPEHQPAHKKRMVDRKEDIIPTEKSPPDHRDLPESSVDSPAEIIRPMEVARRDADVKEEGHTESQVDSPAEMDRPTEVLRYGVAEEARRDAGVKDDGHTESKMLTQAAEGQDKEGTKKEGLEAGKLNNEEKGPQEEVDFSTRIMSQLLDNYKNRGILQQNSKVTEVKPVGVKLSKPKVFEFSKAKKTESKVMPKQEELKVSKTEPLGVKVTEHSMISNIKQSPVAKSPAYMQSTDRTPSFRFQKPVLLNPVSKSIPDSRSKPHMIPEEKITEDNFNPHRLFTNEEIQGREVRLVNVAIVQEEEEQGLAIDAEVDQSGHSVVYVADIVDGGPVQKQGEVDVGDQLMMVEGISLLDKALAPAHTLITRAYQNSKGVMQLIVAKCPTRVYEDQVMWYL